MTGSAQTVNFNNNILTSPPDRLIRGLPNYVGGLVGTNFVAVLLYGTSDSSLMPHTGTARFRVPATASPGTWVGGTRILTGVPSTPGSVIRMQVTVFDNNQFSDYAAARAGGGLFGGSEIFNYTIPTQPPAPGSDSIVNFTGFLILYIPEPSVIGLSLIGIASLVMLRRGK